MLIYLMIDKMYYGLLKFQIVVNIHTNDANVPTFYNNVIYNSIHISIYQTSINCMNYTNILIMKLLFFHLLFRKPLIVSDFIYVAQICINATQYATLCQCYSIHCICIQLIVIPWVRV